MSPAKEVQEAPSCRYYGKSHTVLRATGHLVDQGGNECAAIFDSFAPCKMEKCGAVPDETRCPVAHNYRDWQAMLARGGGR